ncbi:hypothetical protein [Haliangium ochraceum]|uniref:Lipoprotein n=1 Tax=Haliangium ochraceum (strain DSM 14365 / JCM 11303 / SMP-2) TaxID=502025 RepID=D0LNE5_HALO1|nr:hypothetical protein [Haliangium ochraceum]ACY15322.1 hypothetical protein Hoch_2795 [Haliangium ochraceum DSM 14365]
MLSLKLFSIGATCLLVMMTASCVPPGGETGEVLPTGAPDNEPPTASLQDALSDGLLPGEQVGDPTLAPLVIMEDVRDSRAEEDEYTAAGYTEHDDPCPGRTTYRVYQSERGSTIPISTDTIANLCGDIDGCTLRLGMYNWDGTGRVASRESLFYYNTVNRAWRASRGDNYGSDYNGKSEHIMKEWSCYFTDGYYSNWTSYGDSGVGFGLMSWNQYNAECWLTIID